MQSGKIDSKAHPDLSSKDIHACFPDFGVFLRSNHPSAEAESRQDFTLSPYNIGNVSRSDWSDKRGNSIYQQRESKRALLCCCNSVTGRPNGIIKVLKKNLQLVIVVHRTKKVKYIPWCQGLTAYPVVEASWCGDPAESASGTVV